LCGVSVFAARRVDLSQKNAQTRVELKRIAIVRAHHAPFLAALQVANLRAASGDEQKRESGEGAH
jgi:hypothetical protein